MRATVLVSVVLALGCGEAVRAPVVPPKPLQARAAGGVDNAALDRSVSPCDDFYKFACGGWTKATVIPEEEAGWARSFSVLRDENEAVLRAILERYAAGGDGVTSGEPYARPLGDYYAACMDEASAERRDAMVAVVDDLRVVDEVRDTATLAHAVAHLHRLGASPLFSIDSQIDVKKVDRVIGVLWQGGLGLPEREYYLDDQKKALRAEYEAHVARMLVLAGATERDSKEAAAAILSLETKLARASMSNVELRDPRKIYNPMERDKLRELSTSFAWDRYLHEVGVSGSLPLNVAQPEFFRTVGELVTSVPMAEWRSYLRWHLVSQAAPALGAAFVAEDFRMRRVLTGVARELPRAKRCVRAVDDALGEALARPFVDRVLGAQGKAAVLDLVGRIEGAMGKNLAGLSWMDAVTRTRALEKLALVRNKIGYPDRWRSYEGLQVDRGSYYRNLTRAKGFELGRRLGKIGRPVDRGEWQMTPPTVNAYYEATLNEIVFPAGILQAPMFSVRRSAAMNYGAIGMVIGHEITHGFDDEGRQYDGRGGLSVWWSPAVNEEFEKRASCVERQFSAYEVLDGLRVNGKLTLGENIADLGGIKLAYAAYQSLAPEPEEAGAMKGPLWHVPLRCAARFGDRGPVRSLHRVATWPA